MIQNTMVRWQKNARLVVKRDTGPGPGFNSRKQGQQNMNESRKKDELLRRFEAAEPVRVVRIEASMADGAEECEECFLHGDEEGDLLLAGSGYELMSRQYPVRVLILEGVSQQDAKRLLKKIVKWLGEGLDIEDHLSV